MYDVRVWLYLELAAIRRNCQTRLPEERAAIFAPGEGGWRDRVALAVKLHRMTQHHSGVHFLTLDVWWHCGRHEDKMKVLSSNI